MHDCYSSLHESYMEEEMQSRQAFGFLRFAFGYIWKKKNFHYLRLYLDKTADYADAPSARSLHLRNLRFLSCIQRNCKNISRWITVMHDYHPNHAVGKETN